MSMAPSKADVMSCIGKTRWASERAARFALANIRKRSDLMAAAVRPYRCRVRASGKAHWHVGREW